MECDWIEGLPTAVTSLSLQLVTFVAFKLAEVEWQKRRLDHNRDQKIEPSLLPPPLANRSMKPTITGDSAVCIAA